MKTGTGRRQTGDGGRWRCGKSTTSRRPTRWRHEEEESRRRQPPAPRGAAQTAVSGPMGVGGGVARHWAAPVWTMDADPRAPARTAVYGNVERASVKKGVAAGGGSLLGGRGSLGQILG